MADAERDSSTEQEREQYRELLEELRTIIPGVQVLLAFLLTVPFSSRFTELDTTGTVLFVVTLGASALSVVVFLVPTAYHRLTSHTRRTERIRVGVRTTLAGLALLALAIVMGLVVVVRLVYDTPVALAVAVPVLLAIVGLWIGLPMVRESRRGEGGAR